MAALELTPPVFAILGALIEEQFGLHYSLSDRELLQQKASARAVEAGFDSLLDYYYYLRYDPGGQRELAELTETLVVGETYFFREWPAVEVLVDRYIAPRVAAGARPRIWCAACATGEEPLSLAMRLDASGLLDRVEITATDISARALDRARSGRYGKRSVRSVPSPRLLERYLRANADGYTVSPRLVEAIRWERSNLIIDPVGPEQFDAILCRNVLIYFSDHTIRQVLGRLAQALADEGVLVVGVSESLMRYGRLFVGEERSGAFVYRKAVSP